MNSPHADLPWTRRPILWTFTDQTTVGHAVTVLVGVGGLSAVYLFWLETVAGDVSLLVSTRPEAATARVMGLQVAVVACYIWFSVAFMFGKGGPLLNFWLYPLLSILFGVYLLPIAIFGQLPDNLLGETGSTFADPDFVANVLFIFVPGFLVGLALVFGFLFALTYILKTDKEWIDRHLPEEYHHFQEMGEEMYGSDDTD